MNEDTLKKIAIQLERIANAMHGELESDADIVKINVEEMKRVDRKV